RDTVIGPGVCVIVRRYVPVPSRPTSALATRTRYVPVTGATASSITAAPTFHVSPRDVPVGLHSRIHGEKLPASTISPMWTAMRSPAVAVKVHESASPGFEIAPQ